MGVDPAEKDYIVVVQCHIAMQRCSGWACEQAFHQREGGFSVYPADWQPGATSTYRRHGGQLLAREPAEVIGLRLRRRRTLRSYAAGQTSGSDGWSRKRPSPPGG